ncbi:hypothetical protein KP806_18685 [Paenibacillus sp. N4]|uniref:DUF6843 domain-containing protein n=1 Tax=Paenibacillus vietnamensis TaxID=2590547 RepID=UPI001CD044AA|nr:hypothetical protein [Paenibacillus vietnamensis]MCA0757093.1 hypothetical protein [Paenibacillus vietnamensis]
MNRMLFYGAVAVSSYFAGLLAYLGYLSLVYNQGIGSEGTKLLIWTVPPYLFIILPVYTLLFRRERTALWLRVLLLFGLSAAAAASVPFMMGFGWWRLQDLFSPELGLFMLLFASSALVFSIGAFIAAKKRGYLAFLLCSALIAFAAVQMLAAEAEKSRPVLHLIPQSFHGTVQIHYGMPGLPPIPKENGYEVIRIPASGIYKTSSDRPERGIRHILTDGQGKQVLVIQIPGETGKLGSEPGVTISEYEVP